MKGTPMKGTKKIAPIYLFKEQNSGLRIIYVCVVLKRTAPVSVVFDGLLTFILMSDDLILMFDDLILSNTHLRQGCRNLIEHMSEPH